MTREVLIGGKPAALGGRALDVLLALYERRDRVVAKRELFDLVWPKLVVEENNLQVHISGLRKLLGPQVITTVPGRGYRFSATIEGQREEPAVPAPRSAVIAVGDVGVAARTNLPTELPTLIGREAELRVVASLVTEHRAVTIVGAGGIGKSRLGQAVAHTLIGRWPDGAWLVELAGLFEPDRLANAVAQSLGIPMPGRLPAQEELVSELATRSLLLVLDNCEHLLSAVSALVAALSECAPRVRVLATSQEPLHLPQEQQYRLAPLAVPSAATDPEALTYGAVALLEARVQAINPAFSLKGDNLAPAIEICQRLDGIPLAVELAAARAATLGLRPVRDKLDARLRFLAGSARATLPRHQTLRAALDWSYGLLTKAEQTVFQHLGVFAGGFSVELAQALASDEEIDEWAVLDHLSALVDKSLVVADAGDPPRYRLLESARAYALEQLDVAALADLRKRHAQIMRDFVMRIFEASGGLRLERYAAPVAAETDNLRAAYSWACSAEGDLRLAIALASHAVTAADVFPEVAEWLKSLRPEVESGALEPALAAPYWLALSMGQMSPFAPLELRLAAAQRARHLYGGLSQPRFEFTSLVRLANGFLFSDDPAAAQPPLEEARRLLRPDWPAEYRFALLRADAVHAQRLGHWDEAIALHRDAIRAGVAVGDWTLEAQIRNTLLVLLWEMGRADEALEAARSLQEAVRAKPAAPSIVAMIGSNVVGILSEQGRVAEATSAARALLPVLGTSFEPSPLDAFAHLFWQRGQPDLATLLLGAADAAVARTQPRLPTDKRLSDATRAGLEKLQPANVFQRRLAEGAALGDSEVIARITDGLGAVGDESSSRETAQRAARGANAVGLSRAD